MIRLTAIRLDAYDRFQFRVEAPDCVPVVTSDPLKAAEVLTQLGIENPMRLVHHVQAWGDLEIVEPQTKG
jgi:hypothetical protein